jgi:hypothetical protein
MPSNCTRIGADLVQGTQYNVPSNRIAKKPCPKPLYLSPNAVRIGRDPGVLRGLYLAAAYAKYRSAIRTSVGYLILGDSTPKIKLIYQYTIITELSLFD